MWYTANEHTRRNLGGPLLGDDVHHLSRNPRPEWGCHRGSRRRLSQLQLRRCWGRVIVLTASPEGEVNLCVRKRISHATREYDRLKAGTRRRVHELRTERYVVRNGHNLKLGVLVPHVKTGLPGVIRTDVHHCRLGEVYDVLGEHVAKLRHAEEKWGGIVHISHNLKNR